MNEKQIIIIIFSFWYVSNSIWKTSTGAKYEIKFNEILIKYVHTNKKHLQRKYKKLGQS